MAEIPRQRLDKILRHDLASPIQGVVRQGEIISPSWYRLIGYNTVCISIAT